jgi:hypothetical protein
LLAEEEASTAAKKASPKAGAKKATSAQRKSASPGAIAAGDTKATTPVAPALAESSSTNGGEPQEVESFAATGIDNALDLLDVVTAKMDKASVGNQAATIEKHPEVRILGKLAIASNIWTCVLSETIQSDHSLSFGLFFGLADIASRRHSTLSLTGNCLTSEQRCAAYRQILLAFLRLLCS